MPNNLLFVAVGAGILWLGWNGFNGGDPYFAGADATAAVVNTNLATACAMMTWIIMDMVFGKEKKATFLGGVNGMICGLVGITPAAGYVNGVGAIVIGVFTSAVVWVACSATCRGRSGRSTRSTTRWASSTRTASPACSAACWSACSPTRR